MMRCANLCFFLVMAKLGRVPQCAHSLCVLCMDRCVCRGGGSLGPCLERECDALAPAPALLPAVQLAEAVECDEWNGEAQQHDGWSVPAGNEHDAQRGP